MVDAIICATVGNGETAPAAAAAAAAVVVEDGDTGDGMQCSDHPYRNNFPGGVCAFCLQEKLGKLVSSSSSSFSVGSSSPSVAASTSSGGADGNHPPRPPLILPQRKKKNTLTPYDAVLKRSKSTASATPRSNSNQDFSPSPRGGFWAFLVNKKLDRPNAGPGPGPNEGEGNTNTTTFGNGRKVSRSRSVGCGSRSFSGDFFERISTGFGDCTLRRVESQREARRSTSSAREFMKERVRCGGLFGGFIMSSSSSSSSSSTTSYWATSVNEDHNVGSRSNGPGSMAHGRNKSWGWAFASPMRAFNKKSNSSTSKTTTTAPNLAAIPSLLAVRS